MRLVTIAWFVFISGCSVMPARYTKGSTEIHPRWGYCLSDKTDAHVDLEIIVLEYAFFCTTAEPQIASAKQVFFKALPILIKEPIEEISPAELTVAHQRNEIDGTCSMRVGKRVKFIPDPNRRS